MSYSVKSGQTDVSQDFVLRDSTTHAPKADVTITDIDLYYRKSGQAMAAKVDATALAAANSAHADNQAFHLGVGLYRIDWPDAAFSGAAGSSVVLIVVCAGVDTTFREVLIEPAARVASKENIDFGALEKTSLNAATPVATLAEGHGLATTVDLATVDSHIPTAGAIADAVFEEMLSEHLTAGTAGKALTDAATGGAGLTQQQVRDALKLAPSTGDPAAGSVDDLLGDLGGVVRVARVRFQPVEDYARDEYACCWYENGAVVIPTGVTIQVIKRADGSDLIPATAMTRVATTPFFRYDATTTARITGTQVALVVMVATFADGSTATYTEIR